MNQAIMFFVPGIPATAGSKRPFIYRGKADGKQHVAMAPDNKRQKPWMAMVRAVACEALKGCSPVKDPVILSLTFSLLRPKGHFGSGRNAGIVKESAPHYPCGKPDLTKLLRATEDALKGVVWVDDSQVVRQVNLKVYGNRPGVFVNIEVLTNGQPQGATNDLQRAGL